MNIEEIRGRLDAATPGPWHLDAGGDTGVYTERRASGTSRDVASAFERNDEVFIAHAPEDVRRLLSAVEAVEKLHQPRHDTVSALYPVPLCSCEQADYPCETVKAITSALEAS